MSKRGWGILIGVIVVVVVVVIVIAVLLSGGGETTGTPSPSPTPTVTEIASPSPTSSLTPAEPLVPVTCETISTLEFQSMMAQNGWISWETQDEQIGAKPFDRFPDGRPDGAIVCRWGVSPDLATDNVMDLAWSRIETDAATAAQEMLGTEGYERIDAPEGVYFALPGTAFGADAEGYGDTYLFIDDEVRWAMTKADLAFVKAPADEA